MFQKRYAKAYWKQQLKIRSQGKCFSPFSTQNTVSATTMPLLAGGQIIGLPQVICFLRLQVFSASRSTVAQWPKKYAHISLLKVLIIKEDVRKSEDSVIFHFLVWQLRYSPVPTVTSACQLIIMIHLLGMKSRIKIFFFFSPQEVVVFQQCPRSHSPIRSSWQECYCIWNTRWHRFWAVTDPCFFNGVWVHKRFCRST